MPAHLGKIKTGPASHYATAPRWDKGRGTYRLISPDVQRRVAELYESGWKPQEIAFCMALPRTAVADIIATYEYRAQMFFKLSRRRG
jgi:hypothetical protein